MSPTNDIQTPEQLISRALRSLDDDLRQVLILHNGNGDTPGLSFEELTGRLDRPSRDLIAAEKTAIRNLRRPPAARLVIEALKKSDNVIWQAFAGPAPNRTGGKKFIHKTDGCISDRPNQ